MATGIIRSFPLAYHINLHAYGSWIPGDTRGWHHRGDGPTSPPRPGVESLRAISRELQRDPTIALTEPMIALILESIASTSRSRGWTLHAAAAVSSHFHAVVGAPTLGITILQEIRDDSARLLSTRGLRESSARFWSEGGHFTTIHTSAQLKRAIEYVNRHRARPSGREAGD